MPRKKLKLIPAAKASKWAVFDGSDNPGVMLHAEGGPEDLEHVCGACGKVLLVGMEPGRLVRVALRCSCGAYNDGTT